MDPAAHLVKRRSIHSRVVGWAVVPIVFLASPLVGENSFAGEALQWLGYLLIFLCGTGRLWCSLYVSGRKTSDLVTIGPYSVVRNPLYLFSFQGVVGVGLASTMLSFTALVAILFVGYYRFVVRGEERCLEAIHGESYADYRRRVPRWIPRLALWQDVPTLVIEPRRILRTCVESALICLIVPVMMELHGLRVHGCLPSIVTLP